jgi:hypothetical protein
MKYLLGLDLGFAYTAVKIKPFQPCFLLKMSKRLPSDLSIEINKIILAV